VIQDLRSTNHTFVNGEIVGERPRRLVHDDLVRLGPHDARLFEARFVADERARDRRAAPDAAGEPLRRKIGELEAALAARDAEIDRIGALCARLQGELGTRDAALAAAHRKAAVMASEIDALTDELVRMRLDLAGSRDAVERAHRRAATLEAQLEAHARAARAGLEDGNRRGKELEIKLGIAVSELARVRDALAIANDSVRTLEQAYADLLARANVDCNGA
jgi:chromosome segregation ATPase